MDERVFVVSDLHLGGKPGAGAEPSFQMCMPQSRERLSQFFTWAAGHCNAQRTVRLVLAGDIVDFLAEEDALAEHGYRAFTANQDSACRKLERIFGDTADVWMALAAALKGGVRLTMLLGNHDVELALPAPRRALVARLGNVPFEFLHNGEALPLGPVLIEHGNRSDSWNEIDHDSLRELCSELSRNEPSVRSLQTPGSELVVRVMNGLKHKYRFVDLLKPETSAVLPLIAVLEPRAWSEILGCWKLVTGRLSNRTDVQGKPRDRRNIAAYEQQESASEIAPERHDEDLELARELAGADAHVEVRGNARDIGARDTALGWLDAMRAARDRQEKRPHVERLVRALRRLNRDNISFQVDREHNSYLAPVRAALARGFELVVFGHTHLVKRVRLEDGGHVRYLNTGTWADLIRLPDLGGRDGDADTALARFVDDLATNHLASYREQHPTFVQIDRGSGNRFEADVYWFFGDRAEPVPNGILPVKPAARET